MKFHFYCFSFLDKGNHNASTCFGIQRQAISRSVIKKARERAGVTEEAVILGVSYLGEMTEAEFDA